MSSHTRSHIETDLLRQLHSIDTMQTANDENLISLASSCLLSVPWTPPDISDVRQLHKESQYGAWVLVHGYNVNHFTSLINSHKVVELDDIEKTSKALEAAGVPMKTEIEGEAGAPLRQTATQAVLSSVSVMDAGKETTVEWPYAYFELAQRDPYMSPSGVETRYEGFFREQATNLFDMTKH